MGERWVKIYEKLTEWEWYNNADTLRLFLHLLLTVKPRRYRLEGEEFPAGSRVTSMLRLADELNMDRRRVRDAVDNLVSTGEIKVVRKYERDRNATFIVCKFGKYNGQRELSCTETDQQHDQHADQHIDQQHDQEAIDGQVVVQKPTIKATERESFTKEKEFIHREDTLSCVQERAHERAEQDTHNNEFSNFTSSIDPYPRTADEVKTAAALQGIAMTDEEARAFLDYNASVGWMARGEPIRKWKALLNGWHQKELLRERRNQSGNGTKWDSRYVSKDYSHVVSDEIA